MQSALFTALLRLGRGLRDEKLSAEGVLPFCNKLLAETLDPLGYKAFLQVKGENRGTGEPAFSALVGSRHQLVAFQEVAESTLPESLSEFLNEVAHRVSSAFDVREMRQKLEQVVDEKARLEKVAQLGTWHWDPEKDVVTWSDTLFDLFGVERSAGAPPFEEQDRLYHPEDFSYLQSQVREALDLGEPFEAVMRTAPAGGDPRFVMSKGWPTLDGEGKVTALSGTIHDVTDLFKTRQELRLKSNAIDSMFVGFDIVDRDRKLVYVNRSYLEMWGYDSAADVLGTSPAHHCVDPEMPDKIISQLQEHKSGDFEFQARRKDGSTFDVEMYCRLFQDWQGRELYTGVSIDVTERNELRRRYLQAQKMEAVGQLTGGLAHDFNNLLHVILGSLQLGMMDIETDSPLREDLENAVSAAKQASTLVRQLLVFSRRQTHHPEWLNINEIVTSTTRMLHRLMGDNIEVRVRPDPHTKLMRADRGMVEQVLVNLVLNSRDSLRPQGGSVEILVEQETLQDSPFLESHGAEPGIYCKIVVKDTGGGMSEKVKERVFEPFFSTKAEGCGSGLGLPTVASIAQRHAGFVTVKSELGRGTEVSVYFPAPEQPAEISPAPEPPSSTQTVPGKGETILLVEDNALVRSLISRDLVRAGYRVVPAENGQEAARYFERSQGEIDLVITDLSMPKMGGVELLHRVRELDRSVKAIVSTAYSDSSITGKGPRLEGIPLIYKPYSSEELLVMVTRVLHS